MDASAQLIAFAAGDLQFGTDTAAEIGAVLPSAGCTGVAGRDDGIVFDDDRTILAAQTGGTFADCLSNIKIVVVFVSVCYKDAT